MAASPRSTVSSDLYAPSESAQPTVYTKEESSQLDASPAPFSDKQIEETGSRSSDMMDGLDSPGEDEAGSCSPSSGPLNGYTPEASLKRKREHDLESKPVDEPLKTSGVSPDSSFQIREGDILSHVPSNPSKWQDEDPGIGQVKSKRSKIDSGHSKTNGDVGSFRIVSTLPATLWQHVFCFVPPVFLGRLLRVNRAFNTYLTPGNPVEHPTPLGHGIMQPLAAEAIWVASRRRFAPGLPKPIHDFEELKMWRLLVGQSCQVCGHENGSSSLPISDNPCESGPGGFGVRVIWPFGLRCCGSCLHNVSHKVSQITFHFQSTRKPGLTTCRKWTSTFLQTVLPSFCRPFRLRSCPRIVITLPTIYFETTLFLRHCNLQSIIIDQQWRI